MAEEDGNGDGPTIVQLNNVQYGANQSSTPAQQSQHQQQQLLPPLPPQQQSSQLQQQQNQLQVQAQQQMVLNGNAVLPSLGTTTLAIATDVCGDPVEPGRELSIGASNGSHQSGPFQQNAQNASAATLLLGATNQQSIIQNNSHSKSVCRDFLRNVCFRGAQCKFAHPGDSVHGDFVFCHDFQNLGCNRFDCKFVHASKEDERRYLESGKLPSTAANVTPAEANHEPICKDFLKRQCHRGRRCKFRHELASGAAGDKGGSLAARDGTVAIYYDSDRLFQLDGDCSYGGTAPTTNPLLLLRSGERPGAERDRWSPLASRVSLGSLVAPGHPQVAKRRRSSQGPLPFEEEPLMAFIGNLERENRMLRERLEDVQKQVKDLMSTNEFLLQQNAELRLSKQQAQAQAARACSGLTGHAGPAVISTAGAVMSTAGAVISNNVQQQLAAAASNVLPSSVLTSSVLQSVQSAANSLPTGVGPVGPVGGCGLASGVLSSMPNLSNALSGLAPNLSSAVLGAPTGPITSEPTVGLVPVSSIITMSTSSSNDQLVGGYPIVTSQGQLRYNPTRP